MIKEVGTIVLESSTKQQQTRKSVRATRQTFIVDTMSGDRSEHDSHLLMQT